MIRPLILNASSIPKLGRSVNGPQNIFPNTHSVWVSGSGFEAVTEGYTGVTTTAAGYRQINVDVFDRIKEFNKAKNIGEINLTNGLNSIK